MPSITYKLRNGQSRTYLISISACREKWDRHLGDVADIDFSLGARRTRKTPRLYQRRVSLIDFAEKLTQVALDFCQGEVAETYFSVDTQPKSLLDRVIAWHKDRGKRLSQPVAKRRKGKIHSVAVRQKPTRKNVYSFGLDPEGNVSINVAPMSRDRFLSRQFGGVESGDDFLNSVKKFAESVIVSVGAFRPQDAKQAFRDSTQKKSDQWKINYRAARQGRYGKHVQKLGEQLDLLKNQKMLYDRLPEAKKKHGLGFPDDNVSDIPGQPATVTIAS